MATRRSLGRPVLPEAGWPPDDTEESVLGTDLHQTTITNLRTGLHELAIAHTLPGQPPPWRVLGQTAIVAFRRPNGTPYTVLPDVFVYRQPLEESIASVPIATAGPPLLIIEVLSPETYRNDLDLVRGKGYSYAQGGVAEYLTLDPTGRAVPEQIRAWRLVEGQYQPWLPEANGRWVSGQSAVAMGIEGAQAAVYSLEGQRQLRSGEVTPELARRDEALRRKDIEITALRRRLEELQRGSGC